MMPDFAEGLITQWFVYAIKNAPVIIVLAVGLWDNRRQMLACQARNEKLLDQLIQKELDEH